MTEALFPVTKKIKLEQFTYRSKSILKTSDSIWTDQIMLKYMEDDKGCYKEPALAKMLSQHRHHLNIHSLVVLFPLKLHGHDLKQENHMPEIFQK